MSTISQVHDQLDRTRPNRGRTLGCRLSCRQCVGTKEALSALSSKIAAASADLARGRGQRVTSRGHQRSRPTTPTNPCLDSCNCPCQQALLSSHATVSIVPSRCPRSSRPLPTSELSFHPRHPRPARPGSHGRGVWRPPGRIGLESWRAWLRRLDPYVLLPGSSPSPHPLETCSVSPSPSAAGPAAPLATQLALARQTAGSSTTPLGVGLLCWALDARGQDGQDALDVVVAAEDVRAVWLFAGEWKRFVREIRRREEERGTEKGRRKDVWLQVGTMEQAREALESREVDVLVVQGSFLLLLRSRSSLPV